jgi:hypothetical protein
MGLLFFGMFGNCFVKMDAVVGCRFFLDLRQNFLLVMVTFA